MLYQITIIGAGGNGCERHITNGRRVVGCGLMGCPDCEARRFVETLKAQDRTDLVKATMRHIPERVTDDLLTGMRKGSFKLEMKRLGSPFNKSR